MPRASSSHTGVTSGGERYRISRAASSGARGAEVADKMGRMTALRQNVILEGHPVLTAARAALWAGHCALRIPAVVTIGAHGPRMRLTPRFRRYGSTSLYMRRGRYEPTLDVLMRLVKPGDIVFDAGANFGIYSLVLAQRAGPLGCVYAFEPGAEALMHLRRNVSLNPQLNVEVVPVALSDREGPATLAHIFGPPTYSLVEDRSGERVDLVTLDAWSAAAHVSGPMVVKVDVEGHEPAVFAGGLSTLERAKPLLMFEVSFNALRRSGFEHDSSWRVLNELGYEFFRLNADEELERLREVEEGNIFAAHPGSEPGRRLAHT